jgi:hypothetical protein
MYSETAKVGNVLASSERGLETNWPKCFGTNEVFFCGPMKCLRREACEKLVSPWNFD